MLTEDEKARCRYHAGYLGVGEASTFVLGIPSAVQTQFMIEGAFNRVLPSAEARIRRNLDVLDALDAQLFENADALVAKKVGDIELNEDEFKQLMKRYLWFVNGLCNTLGVQRNPFDRRFTQGGGINARVAH